jgi:hypothetical protein
LWRELNANDIAHAVEAQLAPANLTLRPVPAAITSDVPEEHFYTNETFWGKVLTERIRANTTVVLHNFFLFEWFPRSPGLFHTDDGRECREVAQSRLYPLSAEQRRAYEETRPLDPTVYDLDGKTEMLGGGVGCIRLMPKLTENGTLWFMSASSTESAHEGVPVAMSQSDYDRCIGYITDNGVLPCILAGKLKFLPEPLLSLYRDYIGVPRLYLLIEDIQRSHAPSERLGIPRVSVAVTFQQSEYRGEACAAYISFTPGASGSLDERLPWLEYYVTDLYNGTIVTDFDEQMTRFSGAVFSLNKVCNGRLDESEVTEVVNNIYIPHADIGTFIAYQNKMTNYRIKIREEIVTGDRITAGPGAVVVNRSYLSNALNTLSSVGNTDAAAALEQVAKVIEQSKNKEAADLFDAFNAELQRPTPKKTLLKTLWKGVIEALPTIAELTTATAAIVSLFI